MEPDQLSLENQNQNRHQRQHIVIKWKITQQLLANQMKLILHSTPFTRAPLNKIQRIVFILLTESFFSDGIQ